jgi:hypothetical protein
LSALDAATNLRDKDVLSDGHLRSSDDDDSDAVMDDRDKIYDPYDPLQ